MCIQTEELTISRDVKMSKIVMTLEWNYNTEILEDSKVTYPNRNSLQRPRNTAFQQLEWKKALATPLFEKQNFKNIGIKDIVLGSWQALFKKKNKNPPAISTWYIGGFEKWY